MTNTTSPRLSAPFIVLLITLVVTAGAFAVCWLIALLFVAGNVFSGLVLFLALPVAIVFAVRALVRLAP